MNETPAPGAEASMLPIERRACAALAGIYSLRMLGLFMVLPVLSLHAQGHAGYTPVLAGLAIGIYGLGQAALQVPLGLLSDRIGRKPVIVGGLVVFAIGSGVAALSESMTALIVGRALQGFGAISSTVMALAADLTRDSQRTKAMAIIGASIGLSFAVALVLGPALAAVGGLPAVFATTAALALGAIAALLVTVPTPVVTRHDREVRPALEDVGRVLRDPQLLRLDVGILALHFVMTASFVALPLLLRDAGGIGAQEHWKVYLFVLAASLLVLIPAVVYADRRDRLKAVFLGSIGALALAEGGLALAPGGAASIVAWMVLYFAAFNVLEASLPSLVSRVAPASGKGAALGVYSTFQFAGAFLGGVAGGWLHELFGVGSVFGACVLVALAWLAIAGPMRNPRRSTTLVVELASREEAYVHALAQRLPAVPGVTEAVVMPADGVAYLKVERARLDRAALDEAIGGGPG